MKLITDKSLSHLRQHIILFPFMMGCFQFLYVKLYLLTTAAVFFGQKMTTNNEYDLFCSYGTSINHNPLKTVFWIYALTVYLWARPVFSYTNNPENEEFREKTAGKLNDLSSTLIKFFMMVFFFRISEHLFVFKNCLIQKQFLFCHLPVMALSVLTQGALALVYYGGIISQSQSILERLNSNFKTETQCKAISLSTWKKISLITVTNSIIPLVSILILMTAGNASGTEVFQDTVSEAILHMVIVNIVALSFVFHGLWKPVDELIGKMQQVAEGNFDVRIPIYQNDDVSKLKKHFNQMTADLKERENLKNMFGKYLSIEVAKKLMEQKSLNLGGDVINGAVLFCDIRNFTSMSENMTPSEVVEFLNRYFSYITEPILKENGVINKFIGDAVMAVFSPVFDLEDYADAALKSAVGMYHKLSEFNRDFPQYKTEFGIGIHAGPLVAGNIGTEKRLEYTVIGDTVNAASRLESETKIQNLPILLSSQFCEKLSDSVRKNFNLVRVASVKVKGKTEEMELFTPEFSSR